MAKAWDEGRRHIKKLTGNNSSSFHEDVYTFIIFIHGGA
jgi:hypothetical protein